MTISKSQMAGPRHMLQSFRTIRIDGLSIDLNSSVPIPFRFSFRADVIPGYIGKQSKGRCTLISVL